jgi:hypothetical protein
MNEETLVGGQNSERWMPASVRDLELTVFAPPSHFALRPVHPVALEYDVDEEKRLAQAAEAFLLFQKVANFKRKQRRILLLRTFLCGAIIAAGILAVVLITGKSVLPARSRPASAVAQSGVAE